MTTPNPLTAAERARIIAALKDIGRGISKDDEMHVIEPEDTWVWMAAVELADLESRLASAEARRDEAERRIRIIHAAWHGDVAVGPRIDAAFDSLAASNQEPTP